MQLENILYFSSMIKEISAGAIIYKIIDNKIFYLVEYMSLGHISLVKGHLENNETLVDGALREIKEETNLDVTLDTNFKETITYAPYIDKPEILKDVTFFVGKLIDSNQKPLDLHDKEVIKSEFYEFNQAYKLLTHQSDKNTLFKANEYILRKENLKNDSNK